MSIDNSTTLTRRRFLTRGMMAASAAALPYYVPASVLGRDGKVSPSERIVMGGIGIGGRGSYDLGWTLDEPDVQWVAVCDVQKNRRQAAKNAVDSKYGNTDCAAYGEIRQFLAERTDVDAVLIATGDRWHALASVMAMRAGKDVYCEKPACLTMAQGQMVVQTARRYARIYQTGAQRLSEGNHVFAIEMARFIPFTPTAVGGTACVTTGCLRNQNHPRMSWTGTSGSVHVPGVPTTASM